mmetsp:Transcript_29213/g.84586  ORF Transcript_29213/g.84586 Transcript_29213/m.84586 type:complete len:527 (-) Transcript_29213:585-2165(-)
MATELPAASLAEAIERCGAVFALADADGDGKVRVEELIGACRADEVLAAFWGVQDGKWGPLEQSLKAAAVDSDGLLAWGDFMNLHFAHGGFGSAARGKRLGSQAGAPVAAPRSSAGAAIDIMEEHVHESAAMTARKADILAAPASPSGKPASELPAAAAVLQPAQTGQPAAPGLLLAGSVRFVPGGAGVVARPSGMAPPPLVAAAAQPASAATGAVGGALAPAQISGLAPRSPAGAHVSLARIHKTRPGGEGSPLPNDGRPLTPVRPRPDALGRAQADTPHDDSDSVSDWEDAASRRQRVRQDRMETMRRWAHGIREFAEDMVDMAEDVIEVAEDVFKPQKRVSRGKPGARLSRGSGVRNEQLGAYAFSAGHLAVAPGAPFQASPGAPLAFPLSTGGLLSPPASSLSFAPMSPQAALSPTTINWAAPMSPIASATSVGTQNWQGAMPLIPLASASHLSMTHLGGMVLPQGCMPTSAPMRFSSAPVPAVPVDPLCGSMRFDAHYPAHCVPAQAMQAMWLHLPMSAIY